MRGGANCPAARLFFAMLVFTSGPRLLYPQQAGPARTRDVGFALVNFDNGGTYGAITLNESAFLDRPTGALVANGLVSIFQDGRWSMQALLAGNRRSRAIPLRGHLARWFESLHGDLGLATLGTAQQEFMPSMQFTGHARLHFYSASHGVRAGASLARTFDGIGWRTTVIGEGVGWWQPDERTLFSFTSTPMQLQFGDLLGDNEAALSWTRGRSVYEISLGGRFGEASRDTDYWGAFTATWPVAERLHITASAGSYPIDLIQGLPGGRYLSVAVRLPDGKWPIGRSAARPLVPALPPRPPRPELPTEEPLTLVIGPALDSLGIREIRAWAPGVRVLELMADFVDWIPVPLIRQPNGEWQGFYYVKPGIHHINLRLDGTEIAVPRNLPSIRDEFNGNVAVIVVR
ncbi:MAG: hypothetical protein ACT4OZ_12050 [Gemmatimonadota bacterium]